MLFDLLNLIMISTGLFVIITSNQVHALFCLISVFIQMTVLLLVFYELEFVPFLIIIVYIGAIAILFLFVVMMLDINVQSVSTTHSLLGLFIFISLVLWTSFHFYNSDLLTQPSTSYILPEILAWENLLQENTDLKAISLVLYTTHMSSFLLSSFILLIAMLGAISLTLKQKPYVKRQLVLDQTHRDFEKTIKRVVLS
jgi:NADH-quinone oxidoreductase subunit J